MCKEGEGRFSENLLKAGEMQRMTCPDYSNKQNLIATLDVFRLFIILSCGSMYTYSTGRKFSLDFIFHYFANSKFAKFESHLLFELCRFPNDSIYKRMYKTKE